MSYQVVPFQPSVQSTEGAAGAAKQLGDLINQYEKAG